MKPFSISKPAEFLLRSANLDPRRLNAVIDRRLARGDDACLRPHNFYPRQVRCRTGVALSSIWRTNMHLRLLVEARDPYFRYEEWSRDDCHATVLAVVPPSISVAAVGRRLGEVMEAPAFLADQIVSSIKGERESLVQLKVHWSTIT